jgi:hypothetical protein
VYWEGKLDACTLPFYTEKKGSFFVFFSLKISHVIHSLATVISVWSHSLSVCERGTCAMSPRGESQIENTKGSVTKRLRLTAKTWAPTVTYAHELTIASTMIIADACAVWTAVPPKRAQFFVCERLHASMIHCCRTTVVYRQTGFGYLGSLAQTNTCARCGRCGLACSQSSWRTRSVKC